MQTNWKEYLDKYDFSKLPQGPWSKSDYPSKVSFWGGAHSNFAGTKGLKLPGEWLGISEKESSLFYNVSTLENWWQACKATNKEDFLTILNASNAKESKRLGKQVKLREDWEEIKIALMLYGLEKKFSLPQFKSVLLNTGDRVLVEDSPYDLIWGSGSDKHNFKGQNLLGLCQMLIREEMQNQENNLKLF